MSAEESVGLKLDQTKAMLGLLPPLALANVALQDDFSKAFDTVRGTVDPSLKLGF